MPTFATIAEDMSYNHGPMISERHFDEFIAPYYRQLVPRLQELGMLIDRRYRRRRDAAGALAACARGSHGVLPLERQAGVDGMQLRQQFPALRMVGHYDKMVMNRGEAAMRAEFERLLPLMKTRRLHPQRRPPDPARRVAGAVPGLPAPAQGVREAVGPPPSRRTEFIPFPNGL